MNDERTTDAAQLFLDNLHRELDAESALASAKARILIHQLETNTVPEPIIRCNCNHLQIWLTYEPEDLSSGRIPPSKPQPPYLN